MNWLDLAGAIPSLLSTYWFTQNKTAAWRVGLMAAILNILLFWQKQIYGYLLLEIVYVCVMLVGLFQWKRTAHKSIMLISCRQIIILCALMALLASLYHTVLVNFTQSPVPLWDAVTTIICLAAQCLMIYRVLFCWILWFIGDGLVAYLQWDQGMPFHSIVTLVYLGLACMGYLNWRKYHPQMAWAFSPSSLPKASSNKTTSLIGAGLANKNP